MKKLLTAAAVAGAMAMSQAGAVTMVFKGDGNNVAPLGVEDTDWRDCASPTDFCSVDHEAGLSYSLGDIDLQVRSYSGGARDGVDLGDFDRLIQDRNPTDSGFGSYSVGEGGSDDQTQADNGESLEFIFDMEYIVSNVEYNAGGDTDCTNTADGSGEGACGEFLLQIFDAGDALVSAVVIDITNTNFGDWGFGKRFLLTALTDDAGFTIAQLTVREVPIPAALPLLLSGIAGLGFASRKKNPV